MDFWQRLDFWQIFDFWLKFLIFVQNSWFFIKFFISVQNFEIFIIAENFVFWRTFSPMIFTWRAIFNSDLCHHSVVKQIPFGTVILINGLSSVKLVSVVWSRRLFYGTMKVTSTCKLWSNAMLIVSNWMTKYMTIYTFGFLKIQLQGMVCQVNQISFDAAFSENDDFCTKFDPWNDFSGRRSSYYLNA